MFPNLSESLKQAIKIYIWCAVNYNILGTFLKIVNRHSSILSDTHARKDTHDNWYTENGCLQKSISWCTI